MQIGRGNSCRIVGRYGCLLFSMSVLIGCEKSTNREDIKEAGAAVVYVKYYPGYSHTRSGSAANGLVVAVYPDHRVVRAINKDSIGGGYTDGFLSEMEWDRLTTLMDRLLQANTTEYSVEVDCAFLHMQVTWKGRRIHVARSLPIPSESTIYDIEKVIFDATLINGKVLGQSPTTLPTGEDREGTSSTGTEYQGMSQR